MTKARSRYEVLPGDGTGKGNFAVYDHGLKRFVCHADKEFDANCITDALNAQSKAVMAELSKTCLTRMRY